uniref:Uncharacterized protein n=1 Tax=Anguilla anguilla TaxID=7936 RepID=A0A0E9SDF3_ANGAN
MVIYAAWLVLGRLCSGCPTETGKHRPLTNNSWGEKMFRLHFFWVP